MSVPRASSPHVRAKRRRRREEILHSALRAFRARGYHATTLEDIAAQLGMRSAALYHYFPDKAAILYQCHRDASAEVERVLKEARQRFTTPREQLAQVIAEHIRVMTETLQGSPLAFEVTLLPPDHQAEIIAARDRYERGLRRIIDQGIRKGEFRPIDPKLATFVILGAINWIARWYRPEGPYRSFSLGTGFAEYLVGGLTCQPPR